MGSGVWDTETNTPVVVSWMQPEAEPHCEGKEASLTPRCCLPVSPGGTGSASFSVLGQFLTLSARTGLKSQWVYSQELRILSLERVRKEAQRKILYWMCLRNASFSCKLDLQNCAESQHLLFLTLPMSLARAQNQCSMMCMPSMPAALGTRLFLIS